MTMFQEVNAEQLARLFHHYHEALAPDSEKQANNQSSWENTPQPERRRLVAAARLALLELARPATEKRRYFATPGEADWGC